MKNYNLSNKIKGISSIAYNIPKEVKLKAIGILEKIPSEIIKTDSQVEMEVYKSMENIDKQTLDIISSPDVKEEDKKRAIEHGDKANDRKKDMIDNSQKRRMNVIYTIAVVALSIVTGKVIVAKR